MPNGRAQSLAPRDQRGCINDPGRGRWCRGAQTTKNQIQRVRGPSRTVAHPVLDERCGNLVQQGNPRQRFPNRSSLRGSLGPPAWPENVGRPLRFIGAPTFILAVDPAADTSTAARGAAASAARSTAEHPSHGLTCVGLPAQVKNITLKPGQKVVKACPGFSLRMQQQQWLGIRVAVDETRDLDASGETHRPTCGFHGSMTSPGKSARQCSVVGVPVAGGKLGARGHPELRVDPGQVVLDGLGPNE